MISLVFIELLLCAADPWMYYNKGSRAVSRAGTYTETKHGTRVSVLRVMCKLVTL